MSVKSRSLLGAFSCWHALSLLSRLKILRLVYLTFSPWFNPSLQFLVPQYSCVCDRFVDGVIILSTIFLARDFSVRISKPMNEVLRKFSSG